MNQKMRMQQKVCARRGRGGGGEVGAVQGAAVDNRGPGLSRSLGSKSRGPGDPLRVLKAQTEESTIRNPVHGSTPEALHRSLSPGMGVGN